MVGGGIVGGIGFNNVGPQFDGLADQRDNLGQVAIDHIPSRFLIRLKDQRFDHQRHSVPITFRFNPQNILQALIGHFGLVRDPEEIHHHTGRVEADGLQNRLLDHPAEK